MQISRRAFVSTALFMSNLLGTQDVAAQEVEATPAPSDWSTLSAGATFESITQGTVDELLLISELITITRTTMEPGLPGFLSFYNDNPGMIGPRIIYVEQGTVELGPINVSPGSSPGPSLLLRSSAQGEAPAPPAVLLPRSPVEALPGDLVFFPADTAFEGSNFEGQVLATFLEIDVFPTYPPFATNGETVELLAMDLGIETADPPAPPVVDASRLALEPQTNLFSPVALAGPQLLYIEQGALMVTGHDGKLQLKRRGTNNPGGIVESEVELVLSAGDAFLIPPGGYITLQNADVPATLLVLEVRALN